MTYVAAYNSLGFSTVVLGEDRANAAGKRAMQMARGERLFAADPSSYDGSVPREAMGAMSPMEELAYLKARKPRCLSGRRGPESTSLYKSVLDDPIQSL